MKLKGVAIRLPSDLASETTIDYPTKLFPDTQNRDTAPVWKKDYMHIEKEYDQLATVRAAIEEGLDPAVSNWGRASA